MFKYINAVEGGFLLLFVLILTVHIASAQLDSSSWPTFHGNLQRTGLSTYDTSHINGTVKWTFDVKGPIESSPVVGSDGTIYIGTHGGYFYAITQDGKEKWKIKIGTPIEKKGYNVMSSCQSTAAIAKDGTVYIVSLDQYLFAISSNGKIKWKFPIGLAVDSWASPAIGPDGTIYITSSPPKGGLYAINPDGTEKWHYSTSTGMFNSPSIDKNENIYVGIPTGGFGEIL